MLILFLKPIKRIKKAFFPNQLMLKLIWLKNPEKLGLNKPIVIVGFPGVGLVGTIAATYLSYTKDFELVGVIESEKLAPVVSIHNGRPLHPVRVLASKEKNIVVVMSEASIPLSLTLPLADTILNIAKKVKAKLIVSIGGIGEGEKEGVHYIATTKNAEEIAKKLKLDRIDEGATTGVSGVLLSKAYILRKDMLAILLKAKVERSDPKASLNAIKLISKIIEKPLDTSRLAKEAKEYEKSLEEANIKSLSSEINMYG